MTSGAGARIDIALQPITTTSLTEIGRVSVNGRDQPAAGTSSVTIHIDDLISHGIVNVADAFDAIPGVTVQRTNGQANAESAIDIRGAVGVGQYGSYASNESLVLQDGEPLRYGFYGNADLSEFFPYIYQRIELVKGVGGATVYGADTIGGTVNFVTRDPARAPEADLLAGAGTNGQYVYSLYD